MRYAISKDYIMKKTATNTGAKSVKHLAKDYDVSWGFIYDELRRGNLKGTRFGSRVLITAAQEAEWVASKEEWTQEE